MFCNHQLELHYSTSPAFFSVYRCAHLHAMRCQPEELLHLGLTTETKLVRLFRCFTQLTILKRSPSASVKHLFSPRDSTGWGSLDHIHTHVAQVTQLGHVWKLWHVSRCGLSWRECSSETVDGLRWREEGEVGKGPECEPSYLLVVGLGGRETDDETRAASSMVRARCSTTGKR